MMGFLLGALLWGLVLLEEIERMPPGEWKEEGLKKALLLRRTRTRTAFLLTMAVGALFFCVEAWMVWAGRSTFDLDQALGLSGTLYGIVLGSHLYAVDKKGKR